MKEEIFIFTSKYCWEYKFLGHPEAPFRVKDSYEHLLSKKKELNLEFAIVNKEIDEEILFLTHNKNLVGKIRLRNFYDLDTPCIPNIYFYAAVSANIVLESLKFALSGKKTFALTRPPGHHATKDNLGGFCYFNNIAVAINWYLRNYEDSKVAILDIDVHHGNGTEDIFLGNNNVIFISLHQVGIYPGSGLKSIDNCTNFPLPKGCKDDEYLTTLDKAIDIIKKFKPHVLGVSCGFDTFKDDPLAGMELSEECYYYIGKKLNQLNILTFCALEGGYSKKLPYLIENFLRGFAGI